MAQHTTKAARARSGKSPSAAAGPAAPTARKLDGGSKPNALLTSSLAPGAPPIRRAMIAEAACYIAAHRGLADGRGL